jgi:hypothetical protein
MDDEKRTVDSDLNRLLSAPFAVVRNGQRVSVPLGQLTWAEFAEIQERASRSPRDARRI